MPRPKVNRAVLAPLAEQGASLPGAEAEYRNGGLHRPAARPPRAPFRREESKAPAAKPPLKRSVPCQILARAEFQTVGMAGAENGQTMRPLQPEPLSGRRAQFSYAAANPCRAGLPAIFGRQIGLQQPCPVHRAAACSALRSACVPGFCTALLYRMSRGCADLP